MKHDTYSEIAKKVTLYLNSFKTIYNLVCDLISYTVTPMVKVHCIQPGNQRLISVSIRLIELHPLP